MKYALVVLLLLAVASFFTRPPASQDAPILVGARIPPEVLSRIEAACRDCHSNATHYPWYSYLAPVSLLIRDDVTEGRARMNLSEWPHYPSVRRQRYLSEIANQVQDGGMPLPLYTYLHPGAILTEADQQAIFNWTQTERARLITESLTP